MEKNANVENEYDELQQPGQDILDSSETSFVDWARHNTTPIKSLDPEENNDDLKEIAKAIGESRFVALSEGFHNCKEMMKLHHRLIRYLVEYHGFNTICTESGLPESRMAHDYILGENVDVNKMKKQGINGMYSELHMACIVAY